MNYISMNDYFRTPDMNLTACLLCLGYRLEAIDKSNAQKLFVIERDDGLDGVIQQYFAHSLCIDPLLLVHTIKDLKTRIYHV